MFVHLIRSPIGRALLLLSLTVEGTAAAPGADPEQQELMELSLEELMQIEITSVSRKAQKRTDAAAAVYVISNEDIRRSGVTSIPEALRMAPGVEVARVDSNKWAISSRGFNGRFAPKLLVLIDGRSVYTPTFSGVYWEVQDVMLEDVERIEVIRGPGASLWGSNAVNGIINIITKRAQDTRGGLFSFGGGTYEKRFGALRYGAQLGEGTYGRAYVKSFDRGSFDTVQGTSSHDSWQQYRGGFRVDREARSGESLTLQGDAYDGGLGQGTVLPYLSPPYNRYTTGDARASGFNLLGRWSKVVDPASELSIQAYYDHTYRRDLFSTERRDTWDFDFQHRYRGWDRHDVLWGLAYRGTRPEFSNRFPVWFDRTHPVRQLAGGFLQDDITLIPDTLKFTVGAKLEYNQFTGMEGQPNVRLLWKPTRQHTFWGAISRAVRIPSLAETEGTLALATLAPGNSQNPQPFFPLVYALQGNPHFLAEVLWAYELGYRFVPASGISADIALFYNDYDRLRSIEQAKVSLVDNSYLLAQVPFANNMRGETYGAEVALEWRPQPWWHLQANYSYLYMDLRVSSGSVNQSAEPIEGASPRHQVSLRSGFKPAASVDLDFWFRYVDRLPSAGFPDPAQSIPIPSYVTLDARLAWRPVQGLELSVTGQNLLDSRHQEYAQEVYPPLPTQVPRGVYASLSWQF